MLALAMVATTTAMASTINVRVVRFIPDPHLTSRGYLDPHDRYRRKGFARRKHFADQRHHRPDEQILMGVRNTDFNRREWGPSATWGYRRRSHGTSQWCRGGRTGRRISGQIRR